MVYWIGTLGAVSIKRCPLTSIGIPMMNIRLSCDLLIFSMGIPIPGKDGLYIETWPWFQGVDACLDKDVIRFSQIIIAHFGGHHCRTSKSIPLCKSEALHFPCHCRHLGDDNLGAITLKILPSKFKFNKKLVLLKFHFWSSDRYKILNMAWQHSCHAMY